LISETVIWESYVNIIADFSRYNFYVSLDDSTEGQEKSVSMGGGLNASIVSGPAVMFSGTVTAETSGVVNVFARGNTEATSDDVQQVGAITVRVDPAYPTGGVFSQNFSIIGPDGGDHPTYMVPGRLNRFITDVTAAFNMTTGSFYAVVFLPNGYSFTLPENTYNTSNGYRFTGGKLEVWYTPPTTGNYELKLFYTLPPNSGFYNQSFKFEGETGDARNSSSIGGGCSAGTALMALFALPVLASRRRRRA
jgi:hypothetical protein